MEQTQSSNEQAAENGNHTIEIQNGSSNTT